MAEVAGLSNEKELYLEDETFDDARSDFNVVLQRLFKNMLEAGSDEGSITLKLDVTLKSETITNTDPDIEGETREIHLPSFSHKVTSTVQVKDEMKGSKNPNMELVWDPETKTYKLQYVANTEQKTIFDKDIQEAMNRPQNGEEQPKLTGPTNLLPDNGGVIDGDYMEIPDEGDGEAPEAGDDGDYEYDDPQEDEQ